MVGPSERRSLSEFIVMSLIGPNSTLKKLPLFQSSTQPSRFSMAPRDWEGWVRGLLFFLGSRCEIYLGNAFPVARDPTDAADRTSGNELSLKMAFFQTIPFPVCQEKREPTTLNSYFPPLCPVTGKVGSL